MNVKDQLILALDFSDKKESIDFLKSLEGELKWLKVGMELFYKEGPAIIYDLKEGGFSIFLDLKLHDIPNTMEKATKSLLSLPIDMLNFHIASGGEALQRVAALRPKNISFIGVSQLTSMSEERMQKELKIQSSMKETVLSYTKLAKESGLNGVVCSANDAKEIKSLMPDMLCVCPGIRLATDEKNDQVRVTTPSEAIRNGADYLVMGRSITKASQPQKALQEIYQEIKNASQ